MHSHQSARRSATLLLGALMIQVGGAMYAASATADLSMLMVTLVAVFYVLTAIGAYMVRCWLAVAAAVAGGLISCLLPAGVIPTWTVNIGINLVYLVMYLPLQRAFDRMLSEADVSRGTLVLGRGWAMSMLISRAASMIGFLPLFVGQDAISLAQGQFTSLFIAQLGLEIAAMIGGIVSYVFMVRYLWRARGLLDG